MTKEDNGFAAFCFWFGGFLGALIATVIWAFSDAYWAKDRDVMMAECIKTYTYESCIATYRVTPQAPRLDLLKKPSEAP